MLKTNMRVFNMPTLTRTAATLGCKKETSISGFYIIPANAEIVIPFRPEYFDLFESISYITVQWIPDIINVNGMTSGVSYSRTFLHEGSKRN